ncbi:MAG: leucine-rich repeat protein [Prevotellaceae bacterium]|nr:leucine-rich repeat protein [Prevotellaceae bacterium]
MKEVIKKYLYESLRLWVVIGSFVFTYNEAWGWGFEIDGISYSVSDRTAKITGCDYSIKEIVLPDSVDYNGKKYPVTEMASQAFSQHSNLERIKLPKSVIRIGDKCFYYCTSLKSVTLSDSLATIGQSAFSGCSVLDSLTLPNSLTWIGDEAFKSCKGLRAVILPESITWIGKYTFYGCTGLTSLTLPKSLTTIKGAVFYGCSGLTSVKLPENLSEIGEWAFYGCSSLKKLEIPSDIESIGESCLGGCRSLEELVVPFVGTEKNPQGPSENTLLGTLFGTSRSDGCIETVQRFKSGSNSETLVSFYIPEKLSKVTVTGNSDLYYAFYNCCNLKEINLSNTCFIGQKTFYGCSGLTNLTLPESLTKIGADAFQGCSALKSIILPESLTTIGSGAFAECSALKSIVIPQKVSSIYQDAFSNCTGLKTVKLKTTRFLNNVCTLGKIFENCVQEYVFDVDPLTTNAVYSISNLSRVTIGQSCTTIENNALNRATIDTLWISKDIAYVGNQNVTVRHFYYQGSEADWNRVVNKSELEPDEFGIPRIFERDSVKYGIESNKNNASVIKSPNTAKVYICSKIELVGEEFRVISIADNAFKDCTAIDTIFYEGNKVQWEKMIVGKHNDILQEIPIVYNYKKNEENATLGDCYVYLNSCTLKKEKDQELAISMKNTEAITALQFELMLPDGFSVTQNTDGLYKADISTDRSSSTQHDIVEVKKMASNRYLILCSSTTNKTFVGNDGTVISLYIDVDENVIDGDYSFVLKNITLACDNGDVFRTNEINAPVVVHSDIRGDVNNDQEVNIGDISCIANIVLGDIADSYNLKAADVNLDGDINVGDVAYTAEYIINGSFPNTTYMRNIYMLPSNMPMLSVPDFEMQTGSDHETMINLTSNGDITAFQFDIELPKGLRIKREFGKECFVQGRNISDSHILEWVQQENTDMRVIGYSLLNMAFNKGTENLISIELVADKDIMSGVYPIVLKNIVLATKTQTIKLYDQIVYVSVNQTTSINNIINKSITEDVFNIQGIKLQNRQRGINIINRKKVLIK